MILDAPHNGREVRHTAGALQAVDRQWGGSGSAALFGGNGLRRLGADEADEDQGNEGKQEEVRGDDGSQTETRHGTAREVGKIVLLAGRGSDVLAVAGIGFHSEKLFGMWSANDAKMCTARLR